MKWLIQSFVEGERLLRVAAIGVPTFHHSDFPFFILSFRRWVPKSVFSCIFFNMFHVLFEEIAHAKCFSQRLCGVKSDG
jgi:hypothetical protein